MPPESLGEDRSVAECQEASVSACGAALFSAFEAPVRRILRVPLAGGRTPEVLNFRVHESSTFGSART
eukprot:15091377-Alexandrium_andersonii.AAC.1